ncbi:Gfo/Idh/MocA family protein [Clostridium culturomicium]|uniref:Gfo/Idh/MocA family protein n=1 Tax=Clostridium culturomicium TaxID=1499683 RepID=UPI00058F55DE|nr:Gfo/Idh/MocA family oxidoreductase [Clostridium culturomicium]
MTEKIKVIILGAGDRGTIYANYIKRNNDEIDVVAVAEPIKERRENIVNMFNLSEDKAFLSWDEALAAGKIGDVVIVTTQDQMHYEPTMNALELGYDVLLEKPMSPNLRECIEMVNKAEEKKCHLLVCHVLRYTEFFKELKNILDSGEIGELVTIQHIENVGYYHQAHSFVRGNWRNKEESAPMILAKCCHDLDLMFWYAGAKCESLASFGSLKHFKPECAPEGAAERCLDCDIKDCPYDGRKIYFKCLEKIGKDDAGNVTSTRHWPTSAITEDITLEGITKALKEGPYGRCVYHCDNDVVDNQVISLNFENAVTVAFTMTAFTDKVSRITRFMGTKGEVRANTENNVIEVYDFDSRMVKTIEVKEPDSGHGGGDNGIMEDFFNLVKTGVTEDRYTTGKVSVMSHAMAMAAEEARLSKKSINVQQFMEDIMK